MPSHKTSLWFSAPETVEIKESRISKPGPVEVLVRSLCSAISAGTEMLAFQDMLPRDVVLDTSIAGMADNIEYPFRYGYSIVGVIDEVGADVEASWLNKRVFAFHSHESHFLSSISDVILIPNDIHTEDALFIANMETAVNLMLDGAPLIGERVLVTGLGVVGQLLTNLLSVFPLTVLDALDPIEKRSLLAEYVLKKRRPHGVVEDASLGPHEGYDLVFETSGSSHALDLAIKQTSYHGRLVVGSWYGQKKVSLDLGSHFHRSKMSIYASQVSQIDPRLSGRWDKKRRIDVVFDMLRKVEPRSMITHQYHINNAASAYVLLKESIDPVQVILTY